MELELFDSMENRAIELLAHNIPAIRVAESLNVSPARISQLLADDRFAAALASKKFTIAQDSINSDSELDDLEAAVRKKLKVAIGMCFKPVELAKIFQVLNNAKRKNSSVAPATAEVGQVVNLTMPTVLVNKITTNINNQVIQVGESELITAQSGKMQELLNNLHSQSLANSQILAKGDQNDYFRNTPQMLSQTTVEDI